MCGGVGTCNDGNTGDGTCTCDMSGHWLDLPTAPCSACQPGYWGVSCNLTCPVCENGGVCDEGVLGTGECLCQPGYWGPTCKGECKPALDNICHGNGMCLDGSGGSGACVCDGGWKGRYCDQECPGGFANPCHGHGTCALQSDQQGADGAAAVCTCEGVFYGPACDMIADEPLGQCHHYTLDGTLYPEMTPGSPAMFAAAPLVYEAAPNGRAAKFTGAGTGAFATPVDYNYLQVWSWAVKHSFGGGGGGTPAWTACGQRRVDSKNGQTTPATTSTSSIRQLLGAADAQTAHPATFSTAPAHQLLGSANAETTPARAPAAAADRTQRPDAAREGKNGGLSRAP